MVLNLWKFQIFSFKIHKLFTHSPTHTHTYTHPCKNTFHPLNSLTPTHTHAHTHTHTHTHFCTHFLSLSHTHAHTFHPFFIPTDSYAHTHTHTLFTRINTLFEFSTHKCIYNVDFQLCCIGVALFSNIAQPISLCDGR
jgi:hypothetical protein